MGRINTWLIMMVTALAQPWAGVGEVVLLHPGMDADGPVRGDGQDLEDEFPVSKWGRPPAQPLQKKQASFIEPASTDGTSNPPTKGRVPAARSTPSAAMPGSRSTPGSHDQNRVNYASVLPKRGKGVQEVALIAGDLGFFPKTLFVTRDIPVRLFVTGAASKTLCIMMDSFHVRRQIKSQQIQEITFTPGSPGKYRFYCPVNGMEGSLIVKDSLAKLEKR